MRKAVKTITAAILAGTMTLALAACGSTGSSSSRSSESAASTASLSVTSGKTYKVGIVQFVDDASLNQIEKNVEMELDAKAKELGVTFDYEDYTFNGQADGTVLQQIASQLISDKVDLIIPIATPTAQIMQTATKNNPIPIVFSACSDPVGAQLVASMDAPGANITGTSDALNTDAIMDLIFAEDPETDYVGLLYSNSEDASEQAIKDAKEYLDKKGVKYIEKTGTDTTGITDAANALIAEGVDAVFTPTDNTVMTAELAIYKAFAKAGIKHYAGADSFALNGAFCGYGVDYANLGKETADMAADILVNGADPATTPVRTFDNGIAKVNIDVVTDLGLDMKKIQEAFTPYCTEVSEIKTDKNFKE
uniref:ABC transporter substrate-binding protein n=1 Tax=Eubacterium cellulosolvens TaxID=29322 RepID=UPI000554D07D|nr:ABC transporter substrate-binding protein [[Eubacterium] cellulosolvens]